MSGLAALISRQGHPVSPDDVVAMLQAVPYRGPDGMQVRSWPQAVLGHAAFAVTPEEVGEQQPLVSLRTGCAIVADARLDNRDELLTCFPDCSPKSSDTALILRAYDAWGSGAPEHLLGDFAFVIWDPNRRCLVCVRDGAGQRPLFFRQDHRAFAAASEIHQLLQDSTVPVAPNDDRIREALVPFTIGRNEKDRSDTYYAGVQSVLAGHTVTVDDYGTHTRRYWRLTPGREIRYRRRAEYADHFRDLLFRAVKDRLRTASPPGLMLSGGLDSASILCAVQELYRSGQAVDHGFSTVSVVYDGLECDERSYIEALQQRYNFSAHYLAPDLSIETPAGEAPGFRERPNVATSGYDTMLRAATGLGMRAVLTGEISDSCTRGVPMVFDSLLKAGQFADFWRYLRAFRRLSEAPWSKIAALYVAGPLLPLPAHRALAMAYARRTNARMGRSIVPGWMTESLRTWLVERSATLSIAEERDRQVSSESRHWDMIGLSPPEAMIHPAGWPLQLVRPYADRRLQEFLLAVPPQEKFEPHPTATTGYAGSKQLIRRGLCGMLPPSIQTRTEPTHFADAAVDRWRRQWPAIAAHFGPGSHSRLAERGYIDQSRFWARLERLRETGWGLDLLHVNYCLGLESWLRSLERPHHDVVTVMSPWVASARHGWDRRAPIPAAALGVT